MVVAGGWRGGRLLRRAEPDHDDRGQGRRRRERRSAYAGGRSGRRPPGARRPRLARDQQEPLQRAEARADRDVPHPVDRDYRRELLHREHAAAHDGGEVEGHSYSEGARADRRRHPADLYDRGRDHRRDSDDARRLDGARTAGVVGRPAARSGRLLHRPAAHQRERPRLRDCHARGADHLHHRDDLPRPNRPRSCGRSTGSATNSHRSCCSCCSGRSRCSRCSRCRVRAPRAGD